MLAGSLTCAPYLDVVPDPRSRRGCWYSLTAILLVCACAVVAGAKSIDEFAEWGANVSGKLLAALGVRRHRLGWRRCPSAATIGRVLQAVDGDALDRAVDAYLADRYRAATEPAVEPSGPRRAIAVDGKALKDSARLGDEGSEPDGRTRQPTRRRWPRDSGISGHRASSPHPHPESRDSRCPPVRGLHTIAAR
ncbi:transposase family protein [Streptomyces sp. NPDC001156]